MLPRQNVIEHSDEISELNAEDYLEMPEVREEKIVPLTSDGGYPPAENLTPSAFSDEALAAVTPEASQNISAWTPETETARGASWNTAAGGSIVGMWQQSRKIHGALQPRRNRKIRGAAQPNRKIRGALHLRRNRKNHGAVRPDQKTHGRRLRRKYS